MIQQLLLQLILILLNAFFAAAEIALISINENKVRAQAEDGDKKAKKMLKIIEEPTKFLSTIQIGITLAGFLGSAFAADNFAERLTKSFISSFGWAANYYELIDTVSVIIITLILSYFTLVLGELVPKRLAMKHKDKLAGAACGIISVLAGVLRPIIWFLSVSTNIVLRIFGVDPKEKDETVSEEDIVIMLDAGADEGTLKQDDIEYIKNVFKLERMTADEVMTHRNSVVAIPVDATDSEILSIINDEGYSRIPVYTESIDKIDGIIHAKEYLIKREQEGFKLEDIMHEPTYVPESVHLDALFKDMQKKHTHIVVVVSEYGHTSGIITMEDIIEELVGEIWDEQDEAVENIINTAENLYTVLASTPIDEFFEHFELRKDEEIEANTVNGFITAQIGNIPKIGDTVKYENLEIVVAEADELIAKTLMVTVTEKEESEEE